MKAIIIAVGNEVVLGDVINTNASYIADFLKKFAIETVCHITVNDCEKDIIRAVKKSLKQVGLVITTGGLGPTFDDITKKAVTKAIDSRLVKNEESFDKLTQYFKKLGKEMTSNQECQCYFPKGATVIPNENGTADGCSIKDDKGIVMMFPGPPNELIPLLNSPVTLEILKDKKNLIFKEKVFSLFGIGEAKLQEELSDLLKDGQNPSLAPYIKTGEVTLKLRVKGRTQNLVNNSIEKMTNTLYERVGQYIYTDENKELEEVLVDKLKQKKLKIITVESCTGGLIGKKITSVRGSSEVYLGGLITYTNELKMILCDVKKETLDMFGAVSKGTSIEMAEGALKKYGGDIAISVTGIAGPDGGSEEKPVGLVYIGVATADFSDSYRFIFAGNREKVREQSAKNALYLALKNI